ncbi:hypothetical protein [Streptomyces sp. NRRL WC-3744]|uniref:hypothetical protein n=1 Tax=Streptomyces sp. NRRL WC-3744 TaxID=1463935 RepID=UPI0004CAC57B|nr:hypothetical protein [Streptomyces sp. NRRL WC-3744]
MNAGLRADKNAAVSGPMSMSAVAALSGFVPRRLMTTPARVRRSAQPMNQRVVLMPGRLKSGHAVQQRGLA